jgi:hypothetical protein
MSKNKQSSIDWLIDQLEKYELYSKISFQCLKEIEQAKEMEKEQIVNAYATAIIKENNSDYIGMNEETSGEIYYNETFGGKL